MSASGVRRARDASLVRPGVLRSARCSPRPRRTTNPIESTFATVRLRQRVTKRLGSRAAGVAMAFKLIERPDESEVVISKSRDTPIPRS
jgi:hypothetical protein